MEIQLWRSILCPYELAVKELTVKFKHMIEEYHENDRYSPIEQVSGRVKSVSSILEKMQRKDIPIEQLETEMEDLAGVRIICQFEEDIDTVAAIIRKRTDMEVKSEKNYLTHIKQSGYRSYHMILYYTVETIHGPKRLQVEIQIRTMAMNFWATAEHSLRYKYSGNIPQDLQDRLKNCAEAAFHLDQEMATIREEITNAQRLNEIKNNLVANILENIQNLYFVAKLDDMNEINKEFIRLWNGDDMEALKEFNEKLNIMAEMYRV